jgi:hypothetical protein
MDAGHAVGAGGTFEEDKLGRTVAHGEGSSEGIAFFPPVQHFPADSHQIKSFVFFECHIFSLLLHYAQKNSQI